MADLTVCGAGHVAPVDLYDLVSRLQPPVTGHQTVREHLHITRYNVSTFQ